MYITYHQALADRRIAIALFVSIALHIAFMLAPPIKKSEQESAMAAASPPPLNVRIAQPKPPPAELVDRFEPVEVPRPIPVPKRTPAIKPKTPETVEAPKAEEVPPTPVPTPEPAPLAPPFDMAALIAANRERRRATEAAAARGPSSPAELSPDQVAMANINRNVQSITKGGEGTSGVFEILYKGHRTATFAFNGWKSDARKTWREVIEVDAGQGGDIEMAIVRRMITLIRTHYTGDFNWESHRVGRVVVLSARPADTAGLEEFMVREFFGSPTQRSMR